MPSRSGQELYKRAKKIIPGGTQLLSKRPEMFLPEQWPAYFSVASGCEITDLTGKKYLDFSIMGVGSCILGYADPDVTAAVVAAIQAGNLATLNAPEEVELAETLLELHPWAEMVRYARTGGEAMAIAVRLARAASGRDIVLFSGYHGWADWYLAANIADDAALDGHLLSGLQPTGVPRALKDTAIPFAFNDAQSFKKLSRKYESRIGAIVVEPVRNNTPSPEFLDTIHTYARSHGVPLVVDEITAGFRLNVGGSHLAVGWKPDLAVFAKGISNGHPMAAIIGSQSVMDQAQHSFVSSTYWTDRTGPAAALATIRKMRRIDAPSILDQVGARAQQGWSERAQARGLKVDVGGIRPLSHFDFACDQPLKARTAFTQAMLKRGFLANRALYATTAHTPELMERYLDACDQAFVEIAPYIDGGDIDTYLDGPVVHAGFQRLT